MNNETILYKQAPHINNRTYKQTNKQTKEDNDKRQQQQERRQRQQQQTKPAPSPKKTFHQKPPNHTHTDICSLHVSEFVFHQLGKQVKTIVRYCQTCVPHSKEWQGNWEACASSSEGCAFCLFICCSCCCLLLLLKRILLSCSPCHTLSIDVRLMVL